MDKPAVDLLAPTPNDMDAVRQIFQEYADSLNIDLEFQGFESEITAHNFRLCRIQNNSII